MNLDNIIKLLSSESTSEEEKEMIQKWISESQDNARALREFREIDNIKIDADYISHDVDEAWSSLQTKIKDEPNKDEPKVISIPFYQRPWTKVAAMLLFILAGIYVFQQFSGDSIIDNSPTEYVTEISSKAISLDDGSEILLNKSSTLTVNADRKVELRGQAYFDIAKDDSNEFIISTSRGEIIVVGTEFSVISIDDLVEVYVTEGKVIYKDGDRKIDMTVGDYIKVIDGDIIKLKNNDKNYLSWKSGELVFRDATLTEVVTTLERHFGITMLIKDQNAKSICKLTSTFKNQNFKEILTELKTLLGLKYAKDGDVIEIIGAVC